MTSALNPLQIGSLANEELKDDVKFDLLIEASNFLLKEDQDERGTVAAIAQEAAQQAAEGKSVP